MIIQADAGKIPLADESVQCVVTSPPYWGLRDYGLNGDGIGLEKTPEEYVSKLVSVFREVKRVLKRDGTVWLNLGDSYYNYRPGYEAQSKQSLAKHDGAIVRESGKRGLKQEGLKEKDLCGIPWRVAFALQADGWWLRSDIIWSKPNPMPESVTDRCTKSHEYLFLLTKSARYYWDQEAMQEEAAWERWGNQTTEKRNPGTVSWMPDKSKEELAQKTTRNRRSVWTIATQPYAEAHFATFPEKLVTPCILLAGSRIGDTVFDPFVGSGTTVKVAQELGRRGVGTDLKWDYLKLAQKRTGQQCLSYQTG